MRLLVIVHQFLPKHAAGSEYYTYYLSKEMQRRGHEVHLYFTEIDHDRPHAELRTGMYDGLPFHEAVNNHAFPTFRHTYKDAAMEANLVKVLDEVRPELVHIQHLHLHSIGYIDLLAERGLKIAYTLHEYNLMCHRFGQLLRDDRVLCEGPEPEACARCAHVWPAPEQPEPEVIAPPVVAPPPPEPEPPRPVGPPPTPHSPAYRPFSPVRFVRKLLGRYEGYDPTPQPPVAAAAPPPAVEVTPEPPAEPEPVYAEPLDPHALALHAVELRTQEVQAALAKVDLFLAPSRFLRDKFVETGFVDAERILYSDYGMASSKYRRAPRVESSRLRVGYFGVIADWKGIHVLVEAFNGLPEAGIECKIYGDITFMRDYVRELRELRQHLDVQFLGDFANTRVAEVLAEIDVLVVPSIWFENSPLTIHEAFLAGVPVVCSDRGGMAELVEDGVNGLHFRMGDAADLCAKLGRLLREPELLERLRSRFPEIKDIGTDADVMERRYHALLACQSVPS